MTLNLFLSSMIPLVSAAAGAWAAFHFQNIRMKKEIHNQHIAAANKALCTIFILWNSLVLIQKEIINPYRGKPDAWLNMRPTHAQSLINSLTTFQADELTFLLQAKHLNIFLKLFIEEQRFLVAIKLIEERSSIVLNQVWPILGANIPVGGKPTEAEIENFIGFDKVRILKDMTSGIIKNVDEDIESLKLTYGEFQNTMKEIYPKDKFIQFQFGETKNEESLGHL